MTAQEASKQRYEKLREYTRLHAFQERRDLELGVLEGLAELESGKRMPVVDYSVHAGSDPYRIQWSPSARDDFVEVVRHIAGSSSEMAESYQNILYYEVQTQVIRLTEIRSIGAAMPKFGGKDIRELPGKVFRIIIWIDTPRCRLDVVRLWHGSDDVSKAEGV